MVYLWSIIYGGITLSWVNYLEGLEQFERELLPLMREAGLRN